MFPELKEIKIKRQKLGLKQKELANLAGVSQSLIAKLEKGILEPSYGIVKKIFLALDRVENKTEKKCFEIMNKKIIFIYETDNVEKAIKLMKKNSISQIPVFDNIKNKRITGSISEQGIFNYILKGTEKEKLSKIKISEILEPSFPIVSQESPVKSILPLLKINSAILLTKNNQLTGILTKADVI